MTTSGWQPAIVNTWRRRFDVFAVLVHFVLIALVAAKLDDKSTTSPTTRVRLGLILLVEVASFAFHVWIWAGWLLVPPSKLSGFVIDWRTAPWNKFKWAEYAVTATAGTISVALSGNSGASSIPQIVVLSIGGIAQQWCGYTLDAVATSKEDVSRHTRSFIFGALSQAAEFTILIFWVNVNLESPLFWIYGVMWSSFGVIAYARLRQELQLDFTAATDMLFIGADKSSTGPRAILELSEMWYSLMGWVAKLAVGLATIYIAE